MASGKGNTNAFGYLKAVYQAVFSDLTTLWQNSGSPATPLFISLHTANPGATVTGASVTATLKDSLGQIFWGNRVFTDIGSGNYAYAFTASDVPPSSQQAYNLVILVSSGSNFLTVRSSIQVQDL